MTTSAAPRVLVVEDEPDIAALIAFRLRGEGFRVETASSGHEALLSVARETPDLVVLDRMLPGVSGDDVLRSLRGGPATAEVPVLMLTALSEQEDRIEGLQLGADEYLTKPFSPSELVLRVQAILRRAGETGGPPEGRTLRAGPLRMELGAHQVSLEGEEVDLTPTEFRLLQALLERRDRTQTRKQLLERAWDMESDVSQRLNTRTVDMHVRRLRGKLGAVGGWIQTIRGFGYRLKVPGGMR